MKKIIALVLTLALALCTVAMAETTVDITGSWYASFYGMAAQLDLNADGTCAMTIIGDTQEGVWELEGDTLYIDRGQESETKFAVAADSLTAGDGETMITFTREPVEEIVLPAAVTVDDIAAFNGTWTGSIVSAFGMTLDFGTAQAELGEMIGMQDTNMVITDGNAMIFGTNEIPFVFTDGHLLYDASAIDSSLSMTIDMCEDGSIVLEMIGMQFFFEKVAD